MSSRWLIVAGMGLALVIYMPEELQTMAALPFIATALREGVVIYEADEKDILRQ